MSPAQRDAVTYAVGEETGPLFARIAELELSLADAQEQLAELEPMRPLWDALRRIHQNPERYPQTGAPTYWTFGGVCLVASGPESKSLMHALNCAAFDVLPKSSEESQ